MSGSLKINVRYRNLTIFFTQFSWSNGVFLFRSKLNFEFIWSIDRTDILRKSIFLTWKSGRFICVDIVNLCIFCDQLNKHLFLKDLKLFVLPEIFTDSFGFHLI